MDINMCSTNILSVFLEYNEHYKYQTIGSDKMKSSDVSLEKRGYIKMESIECYKKCAKTQLLSMINDDKATIRSTAVLTLSQTYAITKEEVTILVQRLVREKALYTKIYICQVLATLGEEAVIIMLPYLGNIGNNQYQQIPDKISKKKSYPLARDIIARTLANMSIDLFPLLIKTLTTVNETQLSELLDAVGYMMFYHPHVIDKVAIDTMYQIYLQYQSETLIVWKLVTCLSAFTQEQMESLLTIIGKEQVHPMIHLEIERTRRVRPQGI